MAENQTRLPRIFISYRRFDHPEVAAVLEAHFLARFGELNVFRDTSNLEPGEDFVRGIPNRVKKCDVLVALIGPEWVRLIKEKAINELDYVRTEIATALAEKKVIIPICIFGAQKPEAQEIHYQTREILNRNFLVLYNPLNDIKEIKGLLDSIEKIYAARDVLREAVERLEESPPAAGLALGYFMNFIRVAVPRITALSSDGGGYRHLIEVKERGTESVAHTFGLNFGSRPGLKLHIVLPPSLECLLPERLEPVMARLYQASIHAADSSRPFAVDAWKHEEDFQLIDIPRTLGVLNTWLRRRLTKPPRDPNSAEWQELAEEQMQNFELILKWWVNDPANGSDFTERVRVARFTGKEPELGWLGEFWDV